MTASSENPGFYPVHQTSDSFEGKGGNATTDERSTSAGSISRVVKSLRGWVAQRAPFEPPLE